MPVIEYLLKRPVVANLSVVLLVLVGLLTLFTLNRAGYPNVDFDIMKITTVYPGASAEDIEINVTKLIEDELKKIQGIDRVQSSSLENLSLIYVFVDTDAPNIDRAKDDIIRAVDRVADLPSEIDGKPKIEELRSSNVSILELAIHGTAGEHSLRKIARDLEDRILEIPGVGSVERIGYRKREIKIEVSPKKLKDQLVSLQEVIGAIRSHNVRVSGGNLKSFTDEKHIVTYSEFENPLDVGNVIVRSNFSGQKIEISELGTLTDGFEDHEIISRTSGINSINLLIRSQGNADVIDISEACQRLIEDARKTLPAGVEATIVSDFSYYTASMLRIVRNNGLIGFLLVLLCLSVFLTRYTALWTAVGIPVSVLGAFAFFPYFGVGINFISLLTLIVVLGLIVDDAIVVAENITRFREQGLPPREAALQGVKSIRWPVVTTVITTMLAFSSIAFMGGITGNFIVEMPIVVALTLAMSLFESLLILPIHIAHSPVRPVRERPWFVHVRRSYARILRKALRHRPTTAFAFVLFLVFSGSLYFFGMKIILFPPDDIDIINIIAELPEGHSLETTSEKIRELEKIAETIPRSQMVNYVTRVGHHDTDVYGGTAGLHSNWALLTIYLRPASERSIRSEAIVVDLRKRTKELEGYDRLDVQEFYDGPPIGRPVTVTFVGDDDKTRTGLVQEVIEFLKNLSGVETIDVDEKKGKKEIRLRPKYDQMARLEITAQDVGETIRAAYEGIVATELTREGEEIDFRVQLSQKHRRSSSVLKTLHVPNHRGRLIPMQELVHMEPARAYEAIHHYDGRRAATITADVDTEVITAHEANTKVREKFEHRVQKIPGFRIIFGGEEKATEESFRDFYIAFLCVLVAMYFVLVILFNSFGQPLIVLAALPFALGGVFIVFRLHSLPISFLSMIGVLGLVGVLVNDSLILVSHLNEKKKDGPLSLEELVEGSSFRLRPVLLTTITTVAALIPTIYGFGGSEPFLVPIVLALAGGLVFGTTITLILVPTLYSLHARIRTR